ncbi:MAG: hypothetical protein CAPSK01_000211 [Candidatus Accumulibacter vicinus]|uniref:Uncharacterized protein n=1 Tax=Candidatus Accumulibacter vicinus TaxID=2954382 RepID=A0A084Y5R7_9PROT|nr:MAG: hypothetical protein CAPSK01_000211 [Candidatus Accumulibacter vicinus]
MEVVCPASQAAVDVSHDISQGDGGQFPAREFRQPRLDFLQRFVCWPDIRVRFSSLGPSTHLNRETQEVEACLGGVHDVGLRLVEAEVQTVQDMTHHFQRFLYLFSAQDDKVVRVTHEMCG